MHGKVREVKPSADARELEELIAEEPIADRTTRWEGRAFGGRERELGPIDVHLVEHGRPLVAADLGPNGDSVLDLLARAAHLTADECRRLDKEAAWRWGLVAPVPQVPGLPVSRALALVRGRRNGRSDAIIALDAAVAAIMHSRSRGRSGSRLSACISSAGLAVLVRDLIDSETFETLFGTWREIMHH